MKKIAWSKNAVLSRKNIFKYWNNRNKSTLYSKKLNGLFIESLEIISNLPESSQESSKKNVRLKLVRDYYLVYEIFDDTILIIDIWDTRQNPENHPFKNY